MKRILSTILAVLMMTALIGGIEAPALAADASIKKLVAGPTWTLILAADGRLVYTDFFNPGFEVIGNGFTDVAGGMFHVLALKGTTLYAWSFGDDGNKFGQLGDGTNVPKTTPVEIGTGFTAIAADGEFSMALKDKTLFTWGNNEYGQLGDGSTTAKNKPNEIGTGFTDIAAANNYALALKGTELFAWGRNDNGIVIGATAAKVTTPTKIGTGFTAIDAAWGFGMALKGETLFTWGSNAYGQLGNGNFNNSNAFVQVSGTGFTAFSGGSTHALALKNNNLFAWGSNNTGAIGDGTTTNRNTPVQIGPGFTAIAASPTHSVAAKGNEVYLWGGQTPFGYGNKPVLKYTLPPLGSVISVTGVTLAPTTLSLEVGQASTLTATVLPANATNKTVSWSSSNSAVAAVNASGTVIGVSAGSATITATTADGGKTATCAVTVTGGGGTSVPVTGVTLSPKTMTLVVGKTGVLTAVVQPANASNKNVTWSSSNTAVATVNAGTVTAVAAGTATITVTTVDGSRTAFSEVTVTGGPVNVAVTSVSLSATTLRLETRKSATLKATVSPSNATNKAVTWKSNKPDIATVDSKGKVTAVKVGSATITVTTNDGKKTAKCAVTVVNPVTSILVAQTTVYIKNGSTATLRAVPITSDGSTAKLTWASSDKSIVTVDSSGKIKAVKAGRATITASTTNGKSVNILVIVGGKAPSSVAIKNASTVRNMKVGNVARMTFTIKPTDAQGVLAFKSSSTSIVSVNTIGQLSAIKKGNATITVTLGNRKATLKITVK